MIAQLVRSTMEKSWSGKASACRGGSFEIGEPRRLDAGDALADAFDQVLPPRPRYVGSIRDTRSRPERGHW